MVLGPGPVLPREEHSSHPAGRQTQTGEAHQHELLPPLYIPGHDVLSGGTCEVVKICYRQYTFREKNWSRVFFFSLNLQYGLFEKKKSFVDFYSFGLVYNFSCSCQLDKAHIVKCLLIL